MSYFKEVLAADKEWESEVYPGVYLAVQKFSDDLVGDKYAFSLSFHDEEYILDEFVEADTEEEALYLSRESVVDFLKLVLAKLES